MRSRAAAVALLALCFGCGRTDAPPPGATQHIAERAAAIARRYGVEPLPAEGLELATPYSKVWLQDAGYQRSLFFVRDDGDRVLQTRINLARPEVLVVPYTRTMFASFLFQPRPSRVLIVGLGGGAMVRYLERRDSDLVVEAVDIDPQMLAIADRYFGTRGSQRVKLSAADGYQVIRSVGAPYDVIFMDAFLRPSEETDASGHPLRLKQSPFYSALRARLAPAGVAVFNLNPQPQRERDIDELRRSFPQVYLFHDDGDLNWVAVATLDPVRRTPEELAAAAAALPPRFDGDLEYRAMLAQLQPAPPA